MPFPYECQHMVQRYQTNRRLLARPVFAALVVTGLLAALAAWSIGEQVSPPSESESQLRLRPPSAETGQAVVRAYGVPPGVAKQLVGRLQAQYGNDRSVRITLEPRSSRVLVVAPPTVQNKIARQLQSQPAAGAPAAAPRSQIRIRATQATQDQRPTQNQSGRHVVQLSHARWPQIERGLKQVWGERLPFVAAPDANAVRVVFPAGNNQSVQVTIDDATGRVVLEGPMQAATGWSELIRSLDRPAEAGQRTRLVALRHAERKKVQIALAAFQQNAAAQDDAQPPNNGNGQPVAPDADGAGPLPADAAPIGPVQVEFLEGLDVIILRGNPRDVERVVKIIEDIERLSVQTEPEIRVHPLKNVGSKALAELLVPLYGSVLQARQGRVNITALEKPNALLLIGRPESVRAVVSLAEQLDQPVPPATQFRVFQLRHIPAAAAEETIKEFYEERGGLGPQIRILSDFRSNALIVQGSPRDLAEVARLIEEIDVARAKALNEVRVFRLTNSLAEDLAEVLQAAIQNQGVAGPQAPQGGDAAQQRSVMLSLRTLDAQGKRILRSGILSDVTVAADVRANAIVVTGPPENMALIEELIRQLDQLPSAEAQLKVFTIVNGDALGLVEVLEDLFGQATQQAGGQLAADALIIPLRFSVDQRTNSIVVSGARADLEVVEAILLRLDESDIRERKNTVYRLNNAPALDVANAINEFLRSQRQVEQIAPETISPFEQIEREVIVVPEPVNNSLIISATPRYYEEILELVEDLDKRPPMVLIQVLIADVLLQDTQEIGVELGVQDSLLFDRSVAMNSMLDPGFNFNSTNPLGNSDSAQSVATRDHFAPQFLSNFMLMRSSAELNYGGLIISGGNDELNILIRALQDDARLDILSRPQVMTLDNQPAFVQVGQRVPRITSSQITNNATINTTVLENVGILLGVTPRISPEGLVVMEIDAERSELSDEGVPVSISIGGQVVESPIINTITAQTTVSAQSGQTVILGGLITKSDRTNSRRVPWVSDIPVLGNLFRFDSTQRRRTELLFIMTPYIVRDEGDVEMVKQMESERMSWCLSDVVAVHGDVGVSSNGNSHVACWDRHGVKTVFPDVTPTIDGILRTEPNERFETLPPGEIQPIVPDMPSGGFELLPPNTPTGPEMIVPKTSSTSQRPTPPAQLVAPAAFHARIPPADAGGQVVAPPAPVSAHTQQSPATQPVSSQWRFEAPRPPASIGQPSYNSR